MTENENRQIRCGVTLGELLVVIVTIVVVFFMLYTKNSHQGVSDRLQDISHLKQISLAMLNYHSQHDQFPEDIKNEQGEPILSWRVRLLPYLDQAAIYRKFDLTQPWDSEQNIKLASTEITTFRLPNRHESFKEGMFHTCYLIPIGQETEDSPRTLCTENNCVSWDEIEDGSSQTLMVVAAKEEYMVPWTKPDGFQFNPEKPREVFGEYYPGLFLVAFVDGSVRVISPEITDDELLGMFTINGGEPPPEE